VVRRLFEMWWAERELEAIRRSNPGARVSSEAKFVGWPHGMLSLAPRSHIEFGTIVAFGDEHNGFGALSVGAGTWIGPYNNLRLSGDTSIRIGEGCLIAQFCTLVSSNHSLSRAQRIIDAPPSADRRGVTVGNDVWIGAGATILPGTTIGDGAVIGAGSIVTKSVAAYEIWAGNPAAKVGERRD
jgi:acetyltransferase-like isoleucine patch superfamily enzyme